MILPLAGPLQTLSVIQPLIGDPRKAGSYRGYLVHDLSGSQTFLGITHGVHKIGDYIRIRPHITLKLNSLSDPLHPSLSIGKGALHLGIAYRRKDDIRVFCGLRHEQILNHEEFEAL